MATVSTFPVIISGQTPDCEESEWESPLLSVADTYEITDLSPRRKHWEAGIILCDSSGGQVAAGAGTFAVVIKPWATMFYEAPGASATVTATAPTLITWNASTYGVRFVPTGITTATHYKVRLAVARN